MRFADASHARREDADTLKPQARRRVPAPDIAVPTVVLAVIVLACFVWPVIYPTLPPTGGSALNSSLPPLSPGHLLGTDMNGNDMWSRLLYGGRTSLRIAVAVNLLGVLLGGLVGSTSAYAGGLADSITMRVIDALIAFPSLVLVMVVSQTLGPTEINTILALSLVSVPAFARVARTATLRVRGRTFVTAARLCGAGHIAILFGHIAPNVLPQLTMFGLLGMGVVITLEGALTFLGLGVPPPRPTWGNMIFHGQQALFTRPSLVILPSACLIATVFAFNLLAEAARGRWSRS